MGNEGGCTFPLQNKADKRGIYVRLREASPGVGLYDRGKSVLASFNERIFTLSTKTVHPFRGWPILVI